MVVFLFITNLKDLKWNEYPYQIYAGVLQCS
jgi:hypothetical protein